MRHQGSLNHPSLQEEKRGKGGKAAQVPDRGGKGEKEDSAGFSPIRKKGKEGRQLSIEKKKGGKKGGKTVLVIRRQPGAGARGKKGKRLSFAGGEKKDTSAPRVSTGGEKELEGRGEKGKKGKEN